MQIHELKINHKRKRKKRIGRGGKKGTFSGRGVKGQKARAGSTPRPALRDIIKKFPKKRGYTFNTLKKKPAILNLGTLNEKFSDGDIIDLKTLIKKGLVKKQTRQVKILGQGELAKKLNFKGRFAFSSSARAKIEKAKGNIIIQEKKRSTLPKKERQKAKKKTVVRKKPRKTTEANKKKLDKVKKTAKKKTSKK
jgi:large subunit ribosomal protein L15